MPVNQVLEAPIIPAPAWLAFSNAMPVQRAPSRAIDWLPRDRAEAAVSGGGSAGTVAGLESPYRLLTPVNGNVVM